MDKNQVKEAEQNAERARTRHEAAQANALTLAASLLAAQQAVDAETNDPDARRGLREAQAGASKTSEQANTYATDCEAALNRAEAQLAECRRLHRIEELRPIADLGAYKANVVDADRELLSLKVRAQKLEASIEARWVTLLEARRELSELGVPTPAPAGWHKLPASLATRLGSSSRALREFVDLLAPTMVQGSDEDYQLDLAAKTRCATEHEGAQAVRDARWIRGVERGDAPGSTPAAAEVNARRTANQPPPEGYTFTPAAAPKPSVAGRVLAATVAAARTVVAR